MTTPRVTLYVAPQEVVDILEAEGIPLKVLRDTEELAKHCSVQDLTDLQLAHERFPFEFDPVLEITQALSPRDRLEKTRDKDDPLLYRVEESVTTAKLKEAKHPVEFTPVYTLNIVDENTWVAVQQRLHTPSADPNLLLSSNQAFFDALITQVLHTLSFEELCATNLFAYYLGAYKPTRQVA